MTTQPNNTLTLTPNQARDLIALLIDPTGTAHSNVFLWGAPGIGKSSIVRQAADAIFATEYGCKVVDGHLLDANDLPTDERPWFRDWRGSTMDPVDLRGLPSVVNGRSQWNVPSEFPTTGGGIILLDEINRATGMMQNAFFQLVLDRRMGDYRVPPRWHFIAAGNRESDGGGVSKMHFALSNRFATHVNVTSSLDDFSKWGVQNDIDPVVLAFLRFRPGLLHYEEFNRTRQPNEQPIDIKNERSAPTPRSWEFVSNIVKRNPPPELEMAAIYGAVGHGPGVEFMAYMGMYRQLPNLDAILLNPTTAPIPTEVSAMYAVSAGLARRASDTNIGRVIQYLDRLPEEYAVFAIKDATGRDHSIQSTAEFTQWVIKHGDALL